MRLNKKKINSELKRLDWSYAELARQMGRNRVWIYHKLKYDKSGGTTFRTVEAFAKALKVDAKDLIV